MKYRIKLYISFIGLIIITSLIGVGLIYFQTRTFLFNELKSKVLSISATVAALVDGNLVENVKEDPDFKSPSYQALKEQLLRVKNVNRREDLYIEYLYSIHQNPNNPNEVLIGVDAAKKEFIPPGTIYDRKKEDSPTNNLEKYYAPSTFVEDQWGTFLTAYSPILNQNGNFVASLVVNVAAITILQKLHALMLLGILSLSIGVALSIAAAHFLSNKMTNSLSSLREDVEIIGKGDLDHKCSVETKDEFNHLATEINQMTCGLKEKEKIKTTFAKYVSKQVLEKVLESKEEVRLEGERKEVTLLFSDMIGFSKVSEKYQPEEVVSLLNEYFQEMLEIIVKHDGTIDKFIGEGIMVEFGAPIEDKKQEKKAIQAAIEMHKKVHSLKSKWERQGKPSIKLCIGIHTGQAVVGNIGSEQRLEYTAIGDTVNIASRLTALCKSQNERIILSAKTIDHSKIEKKYTRYLGQFQLPGRTKKTDVFSIDPFQEELSI